MEPVPPADMKAGFSALHCAQEKRWVMTNLGSANLELGLSYASFQDAHAEAHLWMHLYPRSVCSGRPEAPILQCVNPSAPQAIPAVRVRRADIFTFTFMHLADAFIQSNLQYIQAIHFLSVCVFPGN